MYLSTAGTFGHRKRCGEYTQLSDSIAELHPRYSRIKNYKKSLGSRPKHNMHAKLENQVNNYRKTNDKNSFRFFKFPFRFFSSQCCQYWGRYRNKNKNFSLCVSLFFFFMRSTSSLRIGIFSHDFKINFAPAYKLSFPLGTREKSI